jgi:hypothetical protein
MHEGFRLHPPPTKTGYPPHKQAIYTEAVLISLAGYDMRDVTTTDSDETTLIGTLQLQAAINVRVMASCSGQIHRRAVECSGCSR